MDKQEIRELTQSLRLVFDGYFNEPVDVVIQRGLGYIRNHKAFECRWLIMSVDGDHVFSPTKFYADADPYNVARFIQARAVGPVNVIVNL